jgi:hypothetical protein
MPQTDRLECLRSLEYLPLVHSFDTASRVRARTCATLQEISGDLDGRDQERCARGVRHLRRNLGRLYPPCLTIPKPKLNKVHYAAHIGMPSGRSPPSGFGIITLMWNGQTRQTLKRLRLVEKTAHKPSKISKVAPISKNHIAAAATKVPEVTLVFWIIKIAATTLGETGGDSVTMTLNWGYLTGTAIFLPALVSLVIAQILTKKFHPFLYWATIVASTTFGTTMADFADRSLGIGYPGGSALLLALLLGSDGDLFRSEPG